MLAHILALGIGLGSFLLYFSAFFFPEVHRKSDFYWSGLGLFYGLVLWVCAGRITGGVLLGAIASTALLLWFGTQTLLLRRALTAPAEKTNVSQNIANRLQALSPQRLWQKIRGGETKREPSPEETSTGKQSESHPFETDG
ncbi:Ycf66 family protein [Halothece sp. PCC 7418]|uniref:Ycf66 family protein n=1 Tax=Halothece sp. (strain PCC 7418) TaxID=65093 RepID=UPI0002A07C0D|nr:Ycf66 family protein [Halothece sp. PCC 7418]AFZ43974.1 Ycf66 family protein [Halothece sp. PCC 7418]